MEFKPFPKWAGGKTQLLPHLVPMAPDAIETYYEPFIGGGALFFALAGGAATHTIEHAVLNDLNATLMATYAAVRDRPEGLLRLLERYDRGYKQEDDEGRGDYYYDVRNAQRPKRLGTAPPLHDVQNEHPLGRLGTAARMIFLNKTCYNGLYRENRKGYFNVPHGSYQSPTIVDRVAITQAAGLLSNVRLDRGDFAMSVRNADGGDFVYFDPPFHPLSKTSNFTSYTSKDFGRDDQERLRELVDDLHSRGVNVMLSNSPHPWIRRLYDDPKFRIVDFPARRMINSRGDRRGVIDELLITNYDPRGSAPVGGPTSNGTSASAD